MKIQISEVEMDKPFFGAERHYPHIFAVSIDGKDGVVDIEFNRNLQNMRNSMDTNHHIGVCVNLSLPDLSIDEIKYIGKRLFYDNTLLKDYPEDSSLCSEDSSSHSKGSGLDSVAQNFDYSLFPNTELRSYVSVPKDERERLEMKLKGSYNWTLAYKFHRKRLKEMGLEVEYSDEDMAKLPFIVIHGTKDSSGTVACNLPSNGDHSFLGGDVDVVKAEYFDRLSALYVEIEQRFGLKVNLRECFTQK